MNNQISLYILIAQFSTLFLGFVLGLLADKIKVWILLLIMHTSLIGSAAIFISGVPTGEKIYTKDNPAPLNMDIGFTLCMMLGSSLFTLNLTLLAKSISSCVQARGILMCMLGFCTSLGTITADSLGGQLYDIDKRNPFFVMIVTECIVVLAIILLAVTKQLRI